ncbi:MAG TPA: class I SAM-dependent methyltransferase [Ilumatobacteraceae bacterium]|nr:class I SAM-dependent methyltransferase [Ilumatobacteraceae bacterium]
MDDAAGDGNTDRFSGFADLYDANRPSPPRALGPLLVSYANVPRPAVIDLGSGTGLSSRWAAGWAGSVIGIEPNDDMRAAAEARHTRVVSYALGVSHRTGLDDRVADVVLAVQAMHWMDPESTLAEVVRILRPGGVFAIADADWPPVSGVARAEHAWATLHARIRVFEARAAQGVTGDQLRRPIAVDDPALIDEDLRDPHRNRAMPGGVRSWSKRQHLERLDASGLFAFTRELVFSEPAPGGDGSDAERFVALMRSQGSYQGLLRLGMTDDELGATDFEREVRAAFADAGARPGLSFSWRVRLGVTPPAP